MDEVIVHNDRYRRNKAYQAKNVQHTHKELMTFDNLPPRHNLEGVK